MEENLYSKFEEAYFDYLGDLQDGVNAYSNQKSKFASEQDERKVEVKLPQIDLPKFNGDYTAWRSFYDLFVSLIHSDSRIPLVQKLHYLKSSLTGEPERILRQFDMVAANYNSAWQLLVKRYNNKRVLVAAQLKRLFNQPTIKQESDKEIKALLDRTQECLHELNGLGVNTTNWDPIILHILVQKLPETTHNLWEQKVSNLEDLPNLNQMFEFLEARFRALEAMTDIKPVKSNVLPKAIKLTSNYHTNQQNGCLLCKGNHLLQQCHNFQRQQLENKQRILKKFGLCNDCFQQHSNEPCRFNNYCTLCKGKHALYKCNDFRQLNLKGKRDFVSKHNLCVNCLKPHNSKACTNRNGCFRCGKHHHTTLHDEQYKGKQVETAKTPLSVPNTSNAVAETNTTNCNYNKNTKQSLLATALVKVESEEGNVISLRALIDLGSQSSFISEAAFQTLKAKGTETSLQITGLGSTKVAHSTKETKFNLGSQVYPNFKIPMEAYVIKKITNILPSR